MGEGDVPGCKPELYETREHRVFQVWRFEHLFGLVPHLVQKVLEVLGRLDRLHAAQRTFRLYADNAASHLILDETPYLKHESG